MSNNVKCKVCGSDTEQCEIVDAPLFKCKKCGLISDHVLYEDAFLKDIYANFYNNETYYQKHIKEHEDMAKNIAIQLGWHKKKVLSIINDILKDKSHLDLMEFGAGVGVVASAVANDKRISYTGFELDGHASSLARSRGCNVQERSLTSDFSESELFDVIISFEVVEHISDLKKAMTNIKKLLKKDGQLIFSVPNFYRYKNYTDKKLHQEPPPVHINFFDKDNVNSFFSYFDMKVVDFIERPYPYLSSPKGHWLKTMTGTYHGANIVIHVKN